MNYFLGIDTSNYTTSVAIINNKNNTVISKRILLNVNIGEKGLRQSEAVFQHTKQLWKLVENVMAEFSGEISAVGVSSKPRNALNSYMPCFLVGVNVAKSIGAVLKVPVFEFSHQSGHIAAALFSVNRLDLAKEDFFAFHISGGTTELLHVVPEKEDVFCCNIIGHSLDLKMGQAIDRAGVMMGLPFPCGKYIDKLAQNGKSPINITPCVKGMDCCLSGIENKCQELISNKETNENVSRFVIDYCLKTLEQIILKLSNEFPKKEIVLAGGVMSNTIIRKNIEKKYNVLFSKPEFSSDNACGTAVLAGIKFDELRS